MKTNKFVGLVVLLLVSELANGEVRREIVITPGLPSSDEVVEISVTNSDCFFSSEVFPPTPGANAISIRLTYALQGHFEQCKDEKPNAPDFQVSVGPLRPGEYSVTLFVNTGALGSGVEDEMFFTVTEALPVTAVSEGGINGFYNNPDSPGQYFYVLETDYTNLVVWNTFDADGNQLWVYGVGDQLNDGQTVVADAYINRSAGFLPSGEIDVAAEPWGVIRLDLTSCLEGKVTYRSELPEFDSGEFPVVRLAYSKQIGCVDLE